MKNYILIIFLLGGLQVFSKDKKPDPKDAKIDSLTKANSALTSQYDSLTSVYNGLYTTIKEKVLKYDFDPAKFSDIIDSLRMSRDAAFMAKTAEQTTKDSLAYVGSEKYKLKTSSDSDILKKEIFGELKQLKELLDDKIITFEEFDRMKMRLLSRW